MRSSVFVAVLMGCALLMTSVVWADVSTGEVTPNFALSDTQGQAHSLMDYKGKFVVLEWWNPQCPFVKKHYNSHNMQNLQKMYTEKGVVWLVINSSAEGKEGYSTPEEVTQLMTSKEAHPTAVLFDSNGKVGKLYGAQTTPHMFVLDLEGVLSYQGAIDSISSADPEDITKATNYVAQALDEAMAGKAVTTAGTKSYGCSVKY